MYLLYGELVPFAKQIVNSKLCMWATLILKFALSSSQVHLGLRYERYLHLNLLSKYPGDPVFEKSGATGGSIAGGK